MTEREAEVLAAVDRWRDGLPARLKLVDALFDPEPTQAARTVDEDALAEVLDTLARKEAEVWPELVGRKP